MVHRLGAEGVIVFGSMRGKKYGGGSTWGRGRCRSKLRSVVGGPYSPVTLGVVPGSFGWDMMGGAWRIAVAVIRAQSERRES